MVRQASCDVSDRNDKGSPDTVWQILGSSRGPFSCSKTSAVQTQDPALASREATLQSEQGGLCQVLQECPPSAGPREHADPCSCPWERALGQGDPGRVGGGASPCTPAPAPSTLAEPPRFPHPPPSGPAKMLFLFDTHQRQPGELTHLPAALTRNLCSRGPFKAPPAPSEGEATVPAALFLLPALGASIHILLGNCLGPN